MRIIEDGAYSRFYLVKDFTAKPHQSEAIPIEKTFILPAGTSELPIPVATGRRRTNLTL